MIDMAAAGPRSNCPSAIFTKSMERKVVELPGPPPVALGCGKSQAGPGKDNQARGKQAQHHFPSPKTSPPGRATLSPMVNLPEKSGRGAADMRTSSLRGAAVTGAPSPDGSTRS